MSLKSNHIYYLDYLRCIAIIGIVFFHTTGMMYADHFLASKKTYYAMYYDLNQRYIVYYGMVIFTALSGYLFASIYMRGKYNDKRAFIIKKAKRLLLPFAIFTPIFIITSTFTNQSIVDMANSILKCYFRGSYGHLWYLPGLFWCFVITIFIFPRFVKSLYFQIAILLVAFILQFILIDVDWNFWGIVHGARWIFFFLVGSLIALYHDKLRQKAYISIILATLSVILLLVHTIAPYDDRDLYTTITLTLSIIPIFILTERFTTSTPPHVIICITSKYSFGIYIFHCWIAPFLISKTAQRLFHLDEFVEDHTILFPAFFFFVTFTLSLAITYFLQKSKVGKMILG